MGTTIFFTEELQMKNTYRVLVAFLIMGVTQDFRAASIIINNKSDVAIFVDLIWNKPRKFIKIEKGNHIKFDSGPHKIKGVRWIKQISPNEFFPNEVYQVTVQDKKAPYNKKFLDRSAHEVLFEIWNNGKYRYYFSGDDSSKGFPVARSGKLDIITP